MEVRENHRSESDDDYIFNDVLTFHRWGEESLPCRSREEDEGHDSRDHVWNEKSDGELLHARNDEEEADRYFEDAEERYESIYREERKDDTEGVVIEHGDKSACWREAEDFESTEPNEDDE